MGNYYTRTVRIYPKSRDVRLDKQQIAEHIVKTALLDSEVNVYENFEDNCLDLRWNSKRAGGELGINKELIDVWEIRGGNYAQLFFNENLIGTRETNNLVFFSFDEIEIKSSSGEFDEIMKDIFPYINPKEWFYERLDDQTVTIPIQGIYRTDCDAVIGDVENKINYLSKDEFLKLEGIVSMIEGCLVNEWKTNSLWNVMNKFHIYERGKIDGESVYPHVDYFQLNWKGRPVAKMDRTDNQHWAVWKYQFACWWDNLIHPDWIAYKALNHPIGKEMW